MQRERSAKRESERSGSNIGSTLKIDDPAGASIFDGTAQNPEWLGQEPERVQNLTPE